MQRAVVIVGIAVAARVPGGGPEMLGEHRQLQIPVAAIAAYSVQEQHQRTRSLDRNREARRRLDEEGFHAYSSPMATGRYLRPHVPQHEAARPARPQRV